MIESARFVLVLLSLLSLPLGGLAPIASSSSTAKPAPFLHGVMNNQGSHFDDEWARGVRATTLELIWSKYEPREGEYDFGYISHMQRAVARLKAQGWYVQLIPGYQYTPAWVFSNYPDMYYVNQYGDRYDPEPGRCFAVTNAPFNPQARALIGRYIARIFQDFDPADFDSVRVGGGVQGEMRYPNPDWAGGVRSYWAFDTHAQDPVKSGIPAELVGWRPGIDPNPGSLERGQLIVNPGFEDSDSYFPIPGWSPDDEVTAVSSLDPRGNVLELSVGEPGRIHQFVPVQPNTTYRFGGWLRSGTGIGRARLFVSAYRAGTQPVSGLHRKLETGSSSWIDASGSITTSADTLYLKVEMAGDQAGSYYFDDLWLMQEGESNSQARDIAVPKAFYEWYLRSLTGYQNWQIAELRKHYSGQLDVLYVGRGLRANHVNDAITNDLRGDGWSEAGSALYAGSVYDFHVAGLADTQGIALYTTGIEIPSAAEMDDLSPYPRRWSGARWIAELARSRDLPVWGENTGRNSAEQLRLSVKRARENGFLGLMWGFESELYEESNGSSYATIADYEAAMRQD